MDQVKEVESITNLPLGVSMTAFDDMLRILSALSNVDSLAIFLYAKDGIASSKVAIEALRLTQKRFYSRIKELLENNLIEKAEGGYRHTILGQILYDMGLSMEKLLINKEKLKIVNELSKSENISYEEKKELMHLFSIEMSSPSKEVFIVDKFENLVSVTIEMLGNAEKEILMATEYIDQSVINVGFNKIQKGITFKGIIDQADKISLVLKFLFSIMTSPKQVAFLYSFLKSPDFQVKFTKIPYTFIITDRKKSIIEIKNPITDDFLFAFVIQSEKFSERLVGVFESLWDIASDLRDKMKI